MSVEEQPNYTCCLGVRDFVEIFVAGFGWLRCAPVDHPVGGLARFQLGIQILIEALQHFLYSLQALESPAFLFDYIDLGAANGLAG